MIALGLALLGAFIVKSSYLLLLYRWQYRYAFGKQVSLARRLMTGYLNMPYTFHLQRNSAETIKTTTETIQRFTFGFLNGLLIVLGELLVIAALTGLLVLVQPLATLGAVVVLGIPTLLIYKATQRHLAEAGRTAEQSFAAVVQWTEQAIGGIKETLVMARAAFFIERQSRHVQRLADCMRDNDAAFGRSAPDHRYVRRRRDGRPAASRSGAGAKPSGDPAGTRHIWRRRNAPDAVGQPDRQPGLRKPAFIMPRPRVLYNELRAIESPSRPRPFDARRISVARSSRSGNRWSSSMCPTPIRESRRPAIDDISLEISHEGNGSALSGRPAPARRR